MGIEMLSRKKPYKNISPPSHQAVVGNSVEWQVESMGTGMGGCVVYFYLCPGRKQTAGKIFPLPAASSGMKRPQGCWYTGTGKTQGLAGPILVPNSFPPLSLSQVKSVLLLRRMLSLPSIASIPGSSPRAHLDRLLKPR